MAAGVVEAVASAETTASATGVVAPAPINTVEFPGATVVEADAVAAMTYRGC